MISTVASISKHMVCEEHEGLKREYEFAVRIFSKHMHSAATSAHGRDQTSTKAVSRRKRAHLARNNAAEKVYLP